MKKKSNESTKDLVNDIFTPDQRDMFTGGDFNRFLEVINVVLFHARKDQFYKEAQTWLQNNCKVVNGKYQLANAALIAQAPAMYKALKDMIELAQDIKDQYSDLCDGENVEKHWQPRIDKAEAILNRIK